MDNNDSNIKSQQTGGLKLMTVFIAVLALHVVVIGGFTVYHLMSGGSTDADLTTTDKIHKDVKGADGSTLADGTTPDASQGEKSAPTPTPPADVATAPANPPTTEPEPAASTVTTAAAAPTPAPAPAPALAEPKPTTPTPPIDVVDQDAPSGPISSELAPPAEPAPAPSVPMTAGPVHMPPALASAPVHEHKQIYVVKITDSYKKIAHAHHITVAQLKEANHIQGNVLHTGQKLVIPSSGTLVAATTLDAAPASAVLNEPAAPMTANLASTSSTVSTTVSHSHLYTVVKGDTLIRIAHKFKTTSAALMAENGISDPTKLAIGKKLKIPSEESRSARNNAPASTPPGQVQAQPETPSGQLANFVP